MKEKLLVLATGLVITLLILEVGLRLTGEFYWRDQGRPGEDTSDTLDPALAQCDGCKRVLCIGDSFTYGVGASPGQDFPSQLQRLLRDDPGHTDTVVINSGVGAFNSRQAIHRLEEYTEVLHLDLVIAMVGPRNSDNFLGYGTHRAHDPGPMDRIRLVRFARFVVSEARGQRVRANAGDRLSHVDSYLRWHENHGTLGDGTTGPSSDLFLRGAALTKAARYEDAAAAFTEGIETQGSSGCHYWGMGMALRGLHQPVEASRWLEEGITVDPTDPYLYVALAMATLDAGEAPEAMLPFLTRGLQAEPDCAALHCMLAPFLPGQEGLDHAVEGVRIDPEEAECYYSLMMISRRMGGTDQLEPLLEDLAGHSPMARSHLDMLRHLDPQHEVARWLESDLNEIVDRAQDHGAAALFLQYPWMDFDVHLANSALANQLMETVSAERGVFFVQTQPRFDEQYRLHSPPAGLFREDGHPNDRGYGLMAQALYDAIVRDGILAD